MTDQVAEIKSKVDIVEVISSHILLKKAGRNFAALCPFHGEKTPSLMVSSERQVFKCFGCGEAGDVFTFLEKIENIDFREALEELAKRAGVKLASYKPTEVSKAKEKILAINNLASKFYSYLLTGHKLGESARKYLKGRGIIDKSWEKFGLGYAPSGWDNLVNFLTKKGFSLADIVSSGLVIARESKGGFGRDHGYYDRFRDRIMFPIKDSRGTILGFSGRVIKSDDQEVRLRSAAQNYGGQAKYINTPETEVFHKGSLLFGLDVAKNAIREKNEIVLVEGEFDVISAHHAGVENVVASKGTALTQQQVTQISRFCENVVVCFDTDLAGDAAARRGIELLDFAGVSIKIVNLNKYKDPDEFARADAAGFKKAIIGAFGIYDYLINSASGRFNPKDAEGKKKIGRELLPTLAKISDDLVRAHYIEKLARILDLETSLVAGAVEKKMDNLPVADTKIQADASANKSGIYGVEEYFLALLVQKKEFELGLLKLLLESDFAGKNAGDFWKWLSGAIIKNSSFKKSKRVGEGKLAKSVNLTQLFKKLPADLDNFVDNLYFIDVGADILQDDIWLEELVKTATRIRDESLKNKLRVISQKLKEAERKDDLKSINLLTRKFDEVSRSMKKGAGYAS